MKATLNVTGKIIKWDLVDTDESPCKLKLQIRYQTTNIFLYTNQINFIEQIIENFNLNDIIEVSGNFVASWYPKSRGSLPVIDEIYQIKKVEEGGDNDEKKSN